VIQWSSLLAGADPVEFQLEMHPSERHCFHYRTVPTQAPTQLVIGLQDQIGEFGTTRRLPPTSQTSVSSEPIYGTTVYVEPQPTTTVPPPPALRQLFGRRLQTDTPESVVLFTFPFAMNNRNASNVGDAIVRVEAPGLSIPETSIRVSTAITYPALDTERLLGKVYTKTGGLRFNFSIPLINRGTGKLSFTAEAEYDGATVTFNESTSVLSGEVDSKQDTTPLSFGVKLSNAQSGELYYLPFIYNPRFE